MKTCVMITGTNGVGKSTLARNIISHFGGVKCFVDSVTYCNGGNVALVGGYGETNFGGVDSIGGTSKLADYVRNCFLSVDTVFCEGSILDTFGVNLCRAIFEGEMQLVVSLYCGELSLMERLWKRTGANKRDFRKILMKQERCMRSALKWRSIGVPVLRIKTDDFTPQEILSIVLRKLNIAS